MSNIYFEKRNYSPLIHYNSLVDIHLQAYYSRPLVRKHLKNVGLINRYGEIIPEEVYKKRLMNRERMEAASQKTADCIVQRAIEIKHLERQEIKRKLESVAKRELVARIRGKSAHNHRVPLLWTHLDMDSHQNDYDPRNLHYNEYDPRKRNTHTSMSYLDKMEKIDRFRNSSMM